MIQQSRTVRGTCYPSRIYATTIIRSGIGDDNAIIQNTATYPAAGSITADGITTDEAIIQKRVKSPSAKPAARLCENFLTGAGGA